MVLTYFLLHSNIIQTDFDSPRFYRYLEIATDKTENSVTVALRDRISILDISSPRNEDGATTNPPFPAGFQLSKTLSLSIMVEAAGIEPASREQEPKEPTCLVGVLGLGRGNTR